MDSSKEPQRMAKRKAAWLPDAHVARMGRQTIKQTSVMTETSCNPGVVSPPDMLWPAQNLAQVDQHHSQPWDIACNIIAAVFHSLRRSAIRDEQGP